MKVTRTGILMLPCVFHTEKTPSLRVWVSGRFYCHGCGERGHVDEHPELASIVSRVRMERLEFKGQLRLPGVMEP